MNDFSDWTKAELDDFEDCLIQRQHDKWWSPEQPRRNRRSLGEIAPELATILEKWCEVDPSDRRPLALRAWRLLSPHISKATFWELLFLVMPQSYQPVRLILRDRKASELTELHLAETRAKQAARQDHEIGLQVLRTYRAAGRAKTGGTLETAIAQVADEHGLTEHRIKQRYDSYRTQAFADGLADVDRIGRLGRGIVDADPIRLTDFPKPWRSRKPRKEL